MKMFLHPLSAASFWLTFGGKLHTLKAVSANEISAFTPTAVTIEHLQRKYPFMPQPYHVFATGSRPRNTSVFRFHSLSNSWDNIKFYQVAPGMIAPSPEATIVALAKNLDRPELIYLARCLCGDFFLSPNNPAGVLPRNSLINPDTVGNFIKHHPGFHGNKEATRALPFLQYGAESPPEAFMSMALGLPYRLGGLGLPDLLPNWTYLASPEARHLAGREYLRPDLMIMRGDKLVAIEYDSDSAHLAGGQAAKDEAKRLALEGDGFKVVSIRPGHLASPYYMTRVADAIRAYLGIRRAQYPKGFSRAQATLFGMDRTFSQFIASWPR